MNSKFKAKTPARQRGFAEQQQIDNTDIVADNPPQINYQDNYEGEIERLKIMGRVIELQIEELQLLKALDELEAGL